MLNWSTKVLVMVIKRVQLQKTCAFTLPRHNRVLKVMKYRCQDQHRRQFKFYELVFAYQLYLVKFYFLYLDTDPSFQDLKKPIVKGYKCLSFLRDKGSNWEYIFGYCYRLLLDNRITVSFCFQYQNCSCILFLYFISVCFSF